MLHKAMIKLIKKIENISTNQSVGKPIFHLDYDIYKIDSSNFIPIKPSIPNRKTAFIDGGNIEILGRPESGTKIMLKIPLFMPITSKVILFISIINHVIKCACR